MKTHIFLWSLFVYIPRSACKIVVLAFFVFVLKQVRANRRAPMSITQIVVQCFYCFFHIQDVCSTYDHRNHDDCMFNVCYTSICSTFFCKIMFDHSSSASSIIVVQQGGRYIGREGRKKKKISTHVTKCIYAASLHSSAMFGK